MKLNLDCRHFRNDLPCKPHKREGAECGDCRHYDRIEERILIVKLDATGDVLRTTFLLPLLRARHPRAHVTWITRAGAVPLFANNPLVDEVIAYESPDCALHLHTGAFHQCYALDASPTCARLAYMARAEKKIGFVWNPRGYVEPTNEAARMWFEMGQSDKLKRANRRTYQSIMAEIAGLPMAPDQQNPVVFLSEDERRFADAWASERGIRAGCGSVLGVNVGAGGRWPLKRWNKEKFAAVIGRFLLERADGKVILLGGPEETALLAEIKSQFPGTRVFGADGKQTLREFAAIVNLCDTVITGDTLCLHLAAALDKRIVAIFGPTSAPEIHVQTGTKVVTDMECACCYQRECPKKPHCMDSIPVEKVYAGLAETKIR